MNTTTRRSLCTFLLFLFSASALMLGCEGAADRDNPSGREGPSDREQKVESKKVKIGPNVFLEVLANKKRRVLVTAEVCLREGQLELFLCRKQTKEHEAILVADVDARDIHKGLILAQAKEGSPVRFTPRYRPASGTTIKISVQYKNKDKRTVTASARSWLKNAKSGKALDSDWVFAGSHLVTNPLDPDGKKHYLANDGDVICVSNFETALLDLPINSPKDNADRIFVADTERIPPLETKVLVILEPVLEEKKEKK